MTMRALVYFTSFLSLVSLAGMGFLGYSFFEQQKKLLENDEQFTVMEEQIGTLASELVRTQESLNLAKTENADFLARLSEDLEDELDKVSDTVDDLEKLASIDPELLQKYSKVFFLNEHYTPSRLREIPEKWVYHENQIQQIHSDVWPFLEDLLKDAEDDDIELFIKSAYRSFDEQSNIKSAHTVVYGEGTANTFSADQGYSEHQLGTTIDFVTTGLNGQVDGFGNTDSYQWLLRNAHKYGFVLSYPENNNYYIFEPWHWRFVGEDLADDLYDDEEHFYDLDQRDIDKYRIKLFD